MLFDGQDESEPVRHASFRQLFAEVPVGDDPAARRHRRDISFERTLDGLLHEDVERGALEGSGDVGTAPCLPALLHRVAVVDDGSF